MSNVVFTIPSDADVNIAKALTNIRQQAIARTENPIIRQFLANTADSSLVENTTAETNYSVNYTISSDLLRAGMVVRVHASGIHSNSGAGTHTIRFRVKLGTTNLVVFDAITLSGSSSNFQWVIDTYTVVKTTGSSGTAKSHGVLFLAHGGATKTVATDNQADNGTVTVNTTTEQALQISVQHGVANLDTESTLKNFIVDILQ